METKDTESNFTSTFYFQGPDIPEIRELFKICIMLFSLKFFYTFKDEKNTKLATEGMFKKYESDKDILKFAEKMWKIINSLKAEKRINLKPEMICHGYTTFFIQGIHFNSTQLEVEVKQILKSLFSKITEIPKKKGFRVMWASHDEDHNNTSPDRLELTQDSHEVLHKW